MKQPVPGQTLQNAGIPFAEFLGDMSLKQKDAAIDAFRDSVSVLLRQEGGKDENMRPQLSTMT